MLFRYALTSFPQAVSFLHRHQIAHCVSTFSTYAGMVFIAVGSQDLDTENLLVQSYPETKVLLSDFEFAVHFEPDEPHVCDLLANYSRAPPEGCKGADPFAYDVYRLGFIMCLWTFEVWKDNREPWPLNSHNAQGRAMSTSSTIQGSNGRH